MEVETPHGESLDSFGKMTALQTAVLAVLLSVFTICSHRMHTETIVLGNEASNQWSHYQAKRIRDFQLQLNTEMLKLTAPASAEVTKTIEDYGKQRAEYRKELEELKKDAEGKDEEGAASHKKAGFFDLAEGLLEISMILSSLYFLSHKKFFPLLGLSLGALGIFVGVAGLLMKG